MDRIAAKFVHGAAEVTREIEVESAADPPTTFSILLPSGYEPGDPLRAEVPWEAVYLLEANPLGDPPWIYRFQSIVDPEE
ncbi:hypothetical protein QEZ54_17000 [Catellatospora sp. KI3]|uniref:hypothetical protein n=1 Tax=Catellatospora sp. KI3 TaxID=3041620 RepID=UPI002482E68E|nr:hypothetical protein [Catellatospora sp. KI3]MDI1462674.1 hypothetical protein [Catellatospora sp. KI3]